MYPAAQTFWLDPTDEVAWGLRRYSSPATPGAFTCEAGYHQALVYVGRAPAIFEDRDGRRSRVQSMHTPRDDERWPTVCEKCSVYRFEIDDRWQDWDELIWRRPSDGAEFVLHPSAPAPSAPSAPAGAMWDAWWMTFRPSPDGIHLMVRLPNGRDWAVDSQASNCTRPGEPHFCWIRHGEPRSAEVTVDKNGDTCAAGAGSIAAGDYHGFLQHGVLTAG